jgi:hypothetical protein
MKTATLLLSFALLNHACVSQQPAKTPPKDPFVVPAGEVSLTDLIDRCAAYLDCNILISPLELGNQPGATQFKLQKAISTDAAGCEEFLAGMLYRFGLALTHVSPQGPTFEILSMVGPRGREISNRAVKREPAEVLARPGLKVTVLTVVPLQHVNATIATNALRPFFASTGAPSGGSLTLGNVGNNSSILLLGFQDQVAQAIRLLQACDVPQPKDEREAMISIGARLEQIEKRLEALEKQAAPAKSR